MLNSLCYIWLTNTKGVDQMHFHISIKHALNSGWIQCQKRVLGRSMKMDLLPKTSLKLAIFHMKVYFYVQGEWQIEINNCKVRSRWFFKLKRVAVINDFVSIVQRVSEWNGALLVLSPELRHTKSQKNCTKFRLFFFCQRICTKSLSLYSIAGILRCVLSLDHT